MLSIDDIMENQQKEETTKFLVKRKERLRLYKGKRHKARASRIHRLKEKATSNKKESTSLNSQVNKLKETMTQTIAKNKLLQRYVHIEHHCIHLAQFKDKIPSII